MNIKQQDNRYVQCLADQQMAKWAKMNPVWVKNMPGQGLQAADLVNTKIKTVSNKRTASNTSAESNKVLGICPLGWAALAGTAYLLFKK